MQWLAPAWLFATAAVVVPILLHLRDRHPPEVIRVGSVADLAPSPAEHRRRRIDDLPLLLVRCLVIVLLAMLLAGPRVATGPGVGGRVAVVPLGNSAVADSLRRVGVGVADVLPSEHPWSLAAWADTAVGSGDTIVMIAPGAGAHYRGVRPVVRHHVTVISLPEQAGAVDTAKVMVVAASPRWNSQQDSVRDLLLSARAVVPVTVVSEAARSNGTIIVGGDTRYGLDSASLVVGALAAPGFLDSLVTRLLPPWRGRPASAQLLPRHEGPTSTPAPLRDLRLPTWWALVGMLAVERTVAARRRR